ncbi:hypothetical protein ISN44_As05g007460 [Arabidopsis suecica]|uniref:Uncharacterized protein n=2 Tax=Arabidopsis TaxID=3701 RepID=A0A8T2D932_ARASU|nr:hypothetical protein ISN44_As05g007460 [Arabidopsis suecica]KAG7608526.1 hypothetical protein ISN44_As05g007460 [Arabidopsis suecica]CAD5331145.1 unnamed protein product [Arabidopsis thaliana]
MHVCNLGYMFLSIWFHKAIKIQLFTTCVGRRVRVAGGSGSSISSCEHIKNKKKVRENRVKSDYFSGKAEDFVFLESR